MFDFLDSLLACLRALADSVVVVFCFMSKLHPACSLVAGLQYGGLGSARGCVEYATAVFVCTKKR